MSGTFVLSIRDYEADGDCIKHYQICKTAEQFFITENVTFSTIAELVTHYQGK